MKFIIYFFSILFQMQLIYSRPELFIKNESNYEIQVKVYPVGITFNGAKECKLRVTHNYSGFDYIIGGVISIPPEITAGYDNDAESHTYEEPPELMGGVIGYGKYRVDFLIPNGNDWIPASVYCYIDYSHSEFTTDPLGNDFFLHYYSDNDLRWTPNYPITAGYTCKIWDWHNPEKVDKNLREIV